ncbi:MAG: DegV family protein [Oscillospiraceae bacterium]|nr:DegV family protein [Oscillospiraceae bacterium]MBQ7130932.1 DegV family protein [Oscillospiraceae bacterium]
MVRIVSDTSTLYSTTQAREAGFAVSALSVTIAGKTYREFDEISSEEFVDIIRQGHMPTSSQPAIGEVEDLYNSYPDEEILNVTMALGLSGTYTGALAAADLCDHSDKITVLNTRTLCGPHRYLVEKAVQWAKEGQTKEKILEKLNTLMDTARSYLVPADFDYLRRGGRLSPLVSYVGKAANLTPIMTQTDNGERLTVAGIRRGFPHAVKYITELLKKAGVGKGWQVQISHAGAMDKAELALKTLKEAMPEAEFHIYPLSPAFITQGGPGCVAVQYIKM